MTQPFLVIDDDPTFTRILARSLTRRGFDVTVARNVEDALQCAKEKPPELITVDLKMEGPSGLTAIEALKEISPEAKILVLTGYASIATAVDAIKLGATNYLPKPADTDEILQALNSEKADPNLPVNHDPMSVNRLEWEHIQKVLAEHEGNISATARALGMHRRTLQRKLQKRPVKR